SNSNSSTQPKLSYLGKSFTIHCLFTNFFFVFKALIIVFTPQLIALAAATIVGYLPETVPFKLYKITGLVLVIHFNLVSSDIGPLLRAFSLNFSIVSGESFLPLFKLPILSRLSSL